MIRLIEATLIHPSTFIHPSLLLELVAATFYQAIPSLKIPFHFPLQYKLLYFTLHLTIMIEQPLEVQSTTTMGHNTCKTGGSSRSPGAGRRHNRRNKRSRQTTRQRRRRGIHETTIASTLLAAYCLCNNHQQNTVEGFRSSATPALSLSLTSDLVAIQQQHQQQPSLTLTRLLATIENDSMASVSSDSDDEGDEGDDDDDDPDLSSYYYLQQQQNNDNNARRRRIQLQQQQHAVEFWSQEMQDAQQALEDLNSATTSSSNNAEQPFYATGTRPSTMAALNGVAQAPSSNLSPKPIPFNNNDDDATTDATIASSGPRQRLISTVKKVWGSVSPLRILGGRRDAVDNNSNDVNANNNNGGAAVNGAAGNSAQESSTSSENNNKKQTREEKKQSKEEAVVARMSRKKKKQLSNLLLSVNRRNTKSMAGMTARTLTGLLSALAEESEGLSVRMNAREDTPLWRKQIDNLSIEFTRLGFKPLYVGGPDEVEDDTKKSKANEYAKSKIKKKAASTTQPPVTTMAPTLSTSTTATAKQSAFSKSLPSRNSEIDKDDNDNKDGTDSLDDETCPVEPTDFDAGVSCADTAFEAIDVDNSGALDKDEIAEALVMAATSSRQQQSGSSGSSNTNLDDIPAELSKSEQEDRKVINQLAKQLVDLYDTNDDGVIDRLEYQSMVEDMAALRQVQKERDQKQEMEEKQRQESTNGSSAEGSNSGGESWWSSAVNTVSRAFSNNTLSDEVLSDETLIQQLNDKEILDISDAAVTDDILAITEKALEGDDNAPEDIGQILLEDMKVDLRQLAFGALPGIKRITPGGPLFLEPFKVTATGSFSPDDIMKSTLLDFGLRQLVSFALRLRVRSIRDGMDGAVFYGRKWKRGNANAPLVECTKLISIEIDDKDRAIITGRAKVRAATDAPVIENSFKLRTRIATPRNGRAIKLSEPEIAIVLECPASWEKAINATFAKMNMKPPPKPEPIYRYIPIHSPFNKNDDTGGYYMGEDNHIKHLSIKNKRLRIEMETVLRPGKFLGSHYLAFTVPQRAIIITVDRVKDGIKAARRRKKTLTALKKARAEETDRKAHHAEDALALDYLEDDKPSSSGDEEHPDQDEEEGKGIVPATKAFISRFVDGYSQAGSSGDNKEKLAHAISDWFGRQSTSTGANTSNSNSATDIEVQRPGDAVTNLIEDITLDAIRDDDEGK